MTIFAVNRNTSEDVPFEVDVRSFAGYQMKEYLVMESEDMKLVNSAKGETVVPRVKEQYTLEDGVFETVLKKSSWNVIRLGH